MKSIDFFTEFIRKENIFLLGNRDEFLNLMIEEYPEKTAVVNHTKPYIRHVFIILSSVIIISCQVYIQYHRGLFKCCSITIKYIFTTLILFAILASFIIIKFYYNQSSSKLLHIYTVAFAFHFINIGYFIKEHRDTISMSLFYLRKLKKYLFPENRVTATECSTTVS